MKIKNYKVKCPDCCGSGYDSFREDGVSFSEGCRKCGGDGDEIYDKRKMKKGSGFISVKFEVLKDKCEYCGGKGKLDCTTIEHGRGIFGEYRKKKSFRSKCEYCLGDGKQLVAFFRSHCSSCGGSGKQSFWKKGLFGTEYKKQKVCNKCSGKGRVDEKSSRVYKDDLSSILEY